MRSFGDLYPRFGRVAGILLLGDGFGCRLFCAMRVCFLRIMGFVGSSPAFGCLDSQAKALFAATEYLKQRRLETAVSPLPGHPHDLVRHFLSSVSSSSVFAECMIEKSLGQVLKYLSSHKGGKVFSSSSFSMAQQRPHSDSSQSTLSFHASCSSLRVSRSAKRPASQSPSRRQSLRPYY